MGGMTGAGGARRMHGREVLGARRGKVSKEREDTNHFFHLRARVVGIPFRSTRRNT